jgi:hypothetical protein
LTYYKAIRDDDASEFGVFILVDHTRATAAVFLDDPIVRNGRA